ncbi:mandelate racemase/muconate lactonizing enzyme family protein [Clostridium sp. HV4-5-A1G]|uniref:mandelate racemase/muconate lactonizing enzyme family protein n=1 Tax=Clostridium sp. HV4-5-A1G TaxID=2004595 RepID=UPI00123AEEF9|nr:mandelate racemase/muconate lactonizing enzyme family protein [Clostridium sp. HV4-5-A1G]KAA8669674.1 mandelate racemase/muconate lactonizing enzyme family protein [Clostridium sp. HV4-5-A1G]
MKITDIQFIPASKYLFVKVCTDDEITGIGEVGVWGFLDAAEGVLNKLKGYLIGKNPFHIEHHWQYMYRSMYFRGSVIMSAISAIDIALWDIKGKALGVPVYELLGGKCRNKVRSYPAVFEFTAEKMAKACKKLKEQGFNAARLMITGDISKSHNDLEDEIFCSKVEGLAEKVRQCREAVGSDFDLCLEVHRSMNPSEAIAFARTVEKYNPLFIEDPIAPDNIDVMAEVADKINISVTTGERFINIQEFEMLMQRKGIRYVRPDVCALGGITPSKKVAALAEANYVGIIPHNPLGPVSTAACLQLDACIPNFAIQEFPSFYNAGNEARMLKEPLIVEKGYIVIPDRPGIGIDLADNISELFPPRQRNINAQIGYDGSVVDV